MTRKNVLLGLLIVVLSLTVVACNKNEELPEEDQEAAVVDIDETKELEQLKEPSSGEEVAIIKTNMGDIKLRLFPEIAPKAVENFKTHAKAGYYDGLIFHRVIKDFMIQTGDPTGTGAGGESIWQEAFEDEFHMEYRNFTGALSMANAGPNTNGSQFFIVGAPSFDSEEGQEILETMDKLGKENAYPKNVVEAYKKLGGTPWLDGVDEFFGQGMGHTVFGQVYEGMDIVKAIDSLEVDERDKPLEDVIIEKIELVEYK